jgi:hypothetical protein
MFLLVCKYWAVVRSPCLSKRIARAIVVVGPLLLLRLAVFGHPLLSRVQPCVVASIIPRHHNVFEILILDCHQSERFLSVFPRISWPSQEWKSDGGTYLFRAKPLASKRQEPLPAALGPERVQAGSLAAVQGLVPASCQTGFGKWQSSSIRT